MKRQIVLIVAIILVGIIAYLGFRFLTINTKASAVDQQQYLGNNSNPPDIYAAAATGQFYSPFNINVAQMDKLMLVDFEGDPDYASIELQTFDDNRGKGARVLLYHHQGTADSYYTDSVFVMQESEHVTFTIVADMTYHFEVTPSGLDAALKMQDKDGKTIEFQVLETARKKWTQGFLAPVGGSKAITFKYFPFFFMKDMNFVLRSGSTISVKIDGVEHKPKKLPIPVDWEFVYLTRYTPSPIICCWNAPHDGPLLPLQPNQDMVCEDGQTRYKLTDNAGHYEIARINGFNDEHNAFFTFSPPIPDLPCLKDGNTVNGRFCGGTDSTSGIIAGVYNVTRQGETISMTIQPLFGWQPIPGPLWVQSWTWNGTVTVAEDNAVALQSAWARKE